jgi:hypothetical protein
MNWPVITLLPLLAISAAFAQNNIPQPQPEEAPPAAQAPAPDPLDDEAQRLVDMLAGSWRTTEAVSDGADHMIVRLAPFVSPTLGHVIYVESAREGDPWTATRQSLFKVYRFGDQLRLRTLDFRSMENRKWEHLIALWAAPELIPGESVNADDVIATMDINLEATGGGFRGATPCPYPTREYGAVEMSSALEVSNDQIVTRDTFYGADGAVVAGAGVTSDAGGMKWQRHETDVEVKRDDDGLIQLIMTAVPGATEKPTEGANVYVHYSGWLTDGTPFDSSVNRGVAYRYVFPGQFVEGWTRAIADMPVGARRKVIIPSELGFGEREDIRSIPPNSTLIFDIEMLKIELPEPTGEAGAEGENPDRPAGGNSADGG